MKKYSYLLICFYLLLSLLLGACALGGERGEESGTRYTLAETHDEVRNGKRLILMYNAGSQAFVGTVTNVTSQNIGCVRVEVHLSNGTELGPTPNIQTLTPNSTENISLDASSESGFTTWSAHPESGCQSGGEGSEGEGREGGGGEHGDDKRHN